MAKRIPNDPIAAHRRESTSKRRLGKDAKCSKCGESRPEALNAKQRPLLCEECKRVGAGASTLDQHHVSGRSNSPFTVPIPANDHRAELSNAQRDWPKQTLENPEGCPFLRHAAAIRGFLDTDDHFKRLKLTGAADDLELVSAFLIEKLGREWWTRIGPKSFTPKRRSDEE